jgi:hypothetical protein
MANLHRFDNGYDDGGNYTMATAYLTRWSDEKIMVNVPRNLTAREPILVFIVCPFI